MQNIKLKWNSFYLEFLYSKLYYIKIIMNSQFAKSHIRMNFDSEK